MVLEPINLIWFGLIVCKRTFFDCNVVIVMDSSFLVLSI
nr:MAG TPA: hypothetical protein [Caudoviricetes sp.]